MVVWLYYRDTLEVTNFICPVVRQLLYLLVLHGFLHIVLDDEVKVDDHYSKMLNVDQP